MTISIVMTTYNGEKYVVEQLNSLLHQNRKADEVIVLDDCSTDSTVQIVENFIQTNHLENWRIQVNPQNVGWMQNFLTGLRLQVVTWYFRATKMTYGIPTSWVLWRK